jgi:hypothetical protein
LQQRRNRYPLFFAKLFFLPKKKRSEEAELDGVIGFVGFALAFDGFAGESRDGIAGGAGGFFQQFKNNFGAFKNGNGDTGKLGDMDTVTAVAGTGKDLP